MGFFDAHFTGVSYQMKKILTAIVVMVVLGFGQLASAQQDYLAAYAGFSIPQTNVWAGVSGSGGYGVMNFNQYRAPVVDTYVSNNYGSVSVYAMPWAQGTVFSGRGGSADVSVTFSGSGSAFSGVMNGQAQTSTYISKSVTLSASSRGDASATVNGGIDVSVSANAFAPPVYIPIFIPVSR